MIKKLNKALIFIITSPIPILLIFFLLPQFLSGTEKLSTADKLIFKQPKASFHLASKELETAKLNHDTMGMYKAYYLLGLIEFFQGDIKKAYKHFDASLELALLENDSLFWAKNKIRMGEYFYNGGHYKKALSLFLKALEISRENGFSDEEASSLMFIGKYYHSTGRFNKSLEYYDQSIKIAKRKHLIDLIIHNKVLKGKGHESKGDYSQAFYYYLQAYELLDSTNNLIILGMTYNHLGNIYHLLGNYQRGLVFHQKALRIRKEIDFKEGAAKSLKNIGEIYEEQGKIDSALNFYKKSLLLSKEIDYKKGIIKCLNNTGRIYSVSSMFSEAEKHLFDALKYSEQINYSKGIVRANHDIGNLFFFKENYDAALKSHLQSLRLAKKMEMQKYAKQNHYSLYKTYKLTGDYKKSLSHLEAYKAIDEILSQEELNKRMAEQRVRFEIDRKNKQNELLIKENQIKNLAINRQNYVIILISILLFILSILFLILYRILSLKKKNNKKLVSLNKELNKTNREKDKFFSIIAHELRNPLWWFRKMVGMLSEGMDNYSRTRIKEVVHSLDESANNAFHLTDNLLGWSRTQLGRISCQPAYFLCDDIINENVKLINSIARIKNIRIVINIKNEKQVFADKSMISTVIRNLLSNALKYTPKNGQIIINCINKHNKALISIKDTGIGIDHDKISVLFNSNEQITTLGIMQEKGAGIGLMLCKEFVRKNKGDIWAESEKNAGTTFYFTLPTSEK